MIESVIKKAELLFICFKSMSEKEGHGLSYELSYNIHKTKAVLVDFYSRKEEAEKGFYEKDDKGNFKKFLYLNNVKIKEVTGNDSVNHENVGFSVPDGRKVEFDEMLKNFDKEVLTLDIKKFNKDLMDKAFKNEVFDGVDLSILFDFELLT